jgi:hypothetical protein
MILIYFAASLEAAVGLLLIISPSFVAEALFGADLSEPGQALGRFAGTVFVAFAVACWPEFGTGKRSPAALRGLLTYNLLATLYFLYIGLDGRQVGMALWPVFALHAILTMLILRAWLTAGVKQSG